MGDCSLAHVVLVESSRVNVADPKPTRKYDPTVYDEFHERDQLCLHCGSRHVTAAHLLRGSRREDDIRGLIPLCGSGSHGCHGAFDSGHSYIGDFGVKVTPEAVKASVAHFLRHEAGDDACAYLIERLGPFGAEAYVQKLEGVSRF
jgi:hypothetical protein